MNRRDQQFLDQSTFDFERDAAPAIAAATDNADELWKTAAARHVRGLAHRGGDFTADDVLERLKVDGLDTHNRSALGGIFRTAQKLGLIEKAGHSVQSRLRHRHRQITVWRGVSSGVSKELHDAGTE